MKKKRRLNSLITRWLFCSPNQNKTAVLINVRCQVHVYVWCIRKKLSLSVSGEGEIFESGWRTYSRQFLMRVTKEPLKSLDRWDVAWSHSTQLNIFLENMIEFTTYYSKSYNPYTIVQFRWLWLQKIYHPEIRFIYDNCKLHLVWTRPHNISDVWSSILPKMFGETVT